jgi:hypothetical protein
MVNEGRMASIIQKVENANFYSILIVVSSLVFLVWFFYSREEVEEPFLGDILAYHLVESLTSDDQEEVKEAAEEYYHVHKADILHELLAVIENPHHENFHEALYRLTLLRSPWVRQKEISTKNRLTLFDRDFSAKRPVIRQNSDEWSENIRRFSKQALKYYSGGHKTSNMILESLQEVAIDETMDFIVERATTHDGDIPLINWMEYYLGYPVDYRASYLCGLVVPEQFMELAHNEELKREELICDLTEAWQNLKVMSVDERIEHCITVWKQKVQNSSFSVTKNYNPEEKGLFIHFEPLIRYGHQAVPLLEKQIESEQLLEWKAIWSIVATTITGEVDEELLNKLMEGNKTQQEYAVELIVAAGCKDHFEHFRNILLSDDTLFHLAEKAVSAIVHIYGKDCLNVLQDIPKDYSDWGPVKYLAGDAKPDPVIGLARHRRPY